MTSENDSEGSISPAQLEQDDEELLQKTVKELSRFDLTEYIHFDPSVLPIAGGGFGDVFKCVYRSPLYNMTVAVKRLRFHKHPGIAKITAKEIYIWSELVHPNIVRFLGYILDVNGLPLIISEWIENGSVLEYVKNNINCDVIHLILGIAEGLAYIHGKDIVHGDIKSDNVLVNASGDAVICDFGISRAMDVITLGGNTTNPNGPGGSTRWVAHELIVNYDIYRKFTKESDVWAFGMTVYELLAREYPYAHINLELQVAMAATRKELPSPPKSFETWPENYRKAWELCKSCWDFDPKRRILMTDAVKELVSLGRTPASVGAPQPGGHKVLTSSAPRQTLNVFPESQYEETVASISPTRSTAGLLTAPTEIMRDPKPGAQFEQMAGTISLATPEELLNRMLGGLSRLNLTGLVSFERSAKNVGHSGDVYRGTYEHPKRGPVAVAVKVLRYMIADSDFMTKVTAKQIYTWSKLDHLNLLPFSGFVIEKGSLPLLVSEWMEGGPVLEYVQKHPECDVIHLINGIAEGLSYLHMNDVVHSDIKSDNILVSESGDSVICDSGISRAMNFSQPALGGNTTLPNGPGGTSRWMAYELIVNSKEYKKPSKESDVWAFGITVSELLTKNTPYVDIHMDLQVLLFVAHGGHPKPPKTFDTWPEGMRNIWGICESCWIKDPEERITMASVVEKLKAISSTEESDPPPVSKEGGQGIDVDPNIRAKDLTGSTLVHEVQDQRKILEIESDVDNGSPRTQADLETHRPEEPVAASVAGDSSVKTESDNNVDSQIIPEVPGAEDHPEIVTEELTALTFVQAEEPPLTKSILPEAQVPIPPTGTSTEGSGNEGATSVSEKKDAPPSDSPPDRSKGSLARFFGGCLKILLCQ